MPSNVSKETADADGFLFPYNKGGGGRGYCCSSFSVYFLILISESGPINIIVFNFTFSSSSCTDSGMNLVLVSKETWLNEVARAGGRETDW
jgi:hypothetical protein